MLEFSTHAGAWREKVRLLLTEQYIEEADGHIRLTVLGRRYADTVAVGLL
jgi:hypothetical protein